MKFQDQGKTRLGFSSLFSQSSQESEGELEISNEVESDEIADELVIVIMMIKRRIGKLSPLVGFATWLHLLLIFILSLFRKFL